MQVASCKNGTNLNHSMVNNDSWHTHFSIRLTKSGIMTMSKKILQWCMNTSSDDINDGGSIWRQHKTTVISSQEASHDSGLQGQDAKYLTDEASNPLRC